MKKKGKLAGMPAMATRIISITCCERGNFSAAGIGESWDTQATATVILKNFFDMKGLRSLPTVAMVNDFAAEFFEELPPCNLQIPFEIIDAWHKRSVEPTRVARTPVHNAALLI